MLAAALFVLLAAPLEQDLLRSGRFRLRETVYDWSLNGVGAGRAKR